jgi:phosphotransferase system  glucose/maltose/N-acetylglucosamine-specific IIC component
MSRWHSLLEYFQFPLKVMFFGVLLLGIGSTIVNTNVEFLWRADSDFTLMLSEILRYSGGFLINIFPVLVFLKLLTKNYEDSVPVILGFVSFFTIMVIVLFLKKTGFPEYFYSSILGVEINIPKGGIFTEGVHVPYNLGIFGLVLAYFISVRMYRRSRHYSMHGIFSFIDHDAYAMLSVIFISVLAGIMITYIWPIVIQVFLGIFTIIREDSSNPLNMFIYGITERLSALCNLSDIPRNAFWLNEYGGTLTDSFGVVYKGDINIWMAQQSLSITQVNAGKFITPFYIINIFIMPAFILAYYSLVSSKKDRKRYRLFIITAVLLSIICGNPLPIELFMLVLSPMLYIIYILIVGFLYAVFQIMGVSIGYSFTGSLMVANPGSSLDLLQYLRDPKYFQTMVTIGTVGAVCFLLFFIFTRIYFKKFAIGLSSLGDSKRVAKKIVQSLGGLDNILIVESTPDKITVGLDRRDKVDFSKLKECGAYLILESREGYMIRLGNISTIVKKEILIMKRNQMAEEEVPTKTEEKAPASRMAAKN